ncbi:MAG: hypothetical protein H0W96_07325 [Solirubrobacterales bacterium]|nr:hypothetical protein [Solirubrobacterales bacterium]
MLIGQPRIVSAPAARWKVHSQALLAFDNDHTLELISDARGRTLGYEMRTSRRRFACALLGEKFTRTLTGDGDAYAPVVSGDRWAAATVERVPGGLRGYEMTLLVGDVRSGRVLRRLRVARADALDPGDVAISPRGDVAVSWFRPVPPRGGTVYGPDAVVSVLRAGQARLSPAQLITRDVAIDGFTAFYGSQMAFGPRGDLAILEQDADTRVRIRTTDGRLGPARHVTGRVEFPEAPVVTAAGTVIVAWHGRHGNSAVASSRLTDDGFGPPQHLSGDRVSAVRIVADSRGASTVGWSTKTETWTADLRPDGRVGPRHRAAGDMKALVSAPDGRLLLITEDHDRALHARLRSVGATSFGEPETIAGTRFATDVVAGFTTPADIPAIVVQRNAPSAGGTYKQALVTATRD